MNRHKTRTRHQSIAPQGLLLTIIRPLILIVGLLGMDRVIAIDEVPRSGKSINDIRKDLPPAFANDQLLNVCASGKPVYQIVFRIGGSGLQWTDILVARFGDDRWDIEYEGGFDGWVYRFDIENGSGDDVQILRCESSLDGIVLKIPLRSTKLLKLEAVPNTVDHSKADQSKPGHPDGVKTKHH